MVKDAVRDSRVILDASHYTHVLQHTCDKHVLKHTTCDKHVLQDAARDKNLVIRNTHGTCAWADSCNG